MVGIYVEHVSILTSFCTSYYRLPFLCFYCCFVHHVNWIQLENVVKLTILDKAFQVCFANIIGTSFQFYCIGAEQKEKVIWFFLNTKKKRGKQMKLETVNENHVISEKGWNVKLTRKIKMILLYFTNIRIPLTLPTESQLTLGVNHALTSGDLDLLMKALSNPALQQQMVHIDARALYMEELRWQGETFYLFYFTLWGL